MVMHAFYTYLNSVFSIKRQIDCFPLGEREINAYKCIIPMDNFISNLGACYIEKWKRCLFTKMLGLTLRYVSVFDVIIIGPSKRSIILACMILKSKFSDVE